MNVPDEVLAELGELRSFRARAPDFDLLDFLREAATPELLLAAMKLLRPALVVHEGDYFLRESFSLDAYGYWSGLGLPRREVQRAMNRVDVALVLRDRSVTSRVAQLVAEAIASFWSQGFGPLGLVALASERDDDDAHVTMFRP